MASSLHTSRLIIPDPEIEEFPWTFDVSPRSKLVKNAEPEYYDGFKFTTLKFNNGFLADTDHKWGYSFESTQPKIFMILPRRTETHSYKLLGSRIQLMSSKQVQAEYCMYFVEDNHSAAPRMWRSFWPNMNGSWNDSIDEMKITFKIQREAKGICEISPNSFEAIHNEILNSIENQVNYKELFLSEHLSDVILECKGQEFPAHRFVLTDRSSVFDRMFQVGLKEVTEGRVLIEDMEPDVLKDLLRFIYCGKVGSVDEIWIELLAAADKYDVRPLKVLCEKEISGQIDAENALDLYTIAEMHGSIFLQEKALDFVRMNKKEILRDREVRRRFASRHPDVAFKVFFNLQ